MVESKQASAPHGMAPSRLPSLCTSNYRENLIVPHPSLTLAGVLEGIQLACLTKSTTFFDSTLPMPSVSI